MVSGALARSARASGASMTPRELELYRALGMTIAALAIAMNGSPCAVSCPECLAAIGKMLDEAKRIRTEGRRT